MALGEVVVSAQVHSKTNVALGVLVKFVLPGFTNGPTMIVTAEEAALLNVGDNYNVTIKSI